MIKSYLKDSNIKSIEYLSLSGPEVKTRLDFRTNIEDFFRHFDIFGKIITQVCGEIEPESNLAKCINTHDTKHEAKTIRIDFGTYKVKFYRRLTCQKWSEVFEIVSECMAHKNKQVGQTQESIINAFDSITNVKDTALIKKLNDQLTSRVINAITKDEDSIDLFLYSNSQESFILASSFQLQLKEEGKCTEIQSWSSSPELKNVIEALRELQKSHDVENAIQKKRIVIEFEMPIDKRRQWRAIQDVIHGSVDIDRVKYFKLGQSWCNILEKGNERINMAFERLAKNAVFKDEKYTVFSLLDVLKYPWSYKKQSFSIDDMQQVLGITETDAKHIVNILLGKVRPCTGDTFLLTKKYKNMYLLPSSKSAVVGLVKEIAAALDDKKKDLEVTLKYIWDLSQKKITVKDKMKKIMEREFEVVTSVMQEHGETQTTYQVKNPIISCETKLKLKDKLHTVDITDLLSYLRSLLPLSEGEYNELYLHPQHKNLDIIPGDRVLVKNVELFDILIHDPEERVTYLVHNKNGFGVNVRAVCSQIRVSASLLWTDYMEGRQTNAEGFWEAGTSKDAHTVYRIQLRDKLCDIGRDKLIRYFANDVKIVYVLGFRDGRKDLLKEPWRVNSTIAKIELLTLFADFAKYQVGGWRKIELKLLQLKSDDGSDNNKRKFDGKAPKQKKKQQTK